MSPAGACPPAAGNRVMPAGNSRPLVAAPMLATAVARIRAASPRRWIGEDRVADRRDLRPNSNMAIRGADRAAGKGA
jgi:hypothetical protein